MSNGSLKMLIDVDHKFFSRLSASRERYNPSKQGEASYYGGDPGSIPFLWESQPGTPKHALADDPLPPLTPPPYYHHRSSPHIQRKVAKSSSGILNSILPKIPSKKTNTPSPLFSPHSSSSSSFSSSQSPSPTPARRRKNITSRISNYDYNGDDGGGDACSRSIGRIGLYEGGEFGEAGKCWRGPTLCFGPRSVSPSMRRRIKGFYYPIKSLKKVVVSMVGHGKD